MNDESISGDFPFADKNRKINSFTISKVDVNLWHTRLGYPNNKILVQVLKSINNKVASHDGVSF